VYSQPAATARTPAISRRQSVARLRMLPTRAATPKQAKAAARTCPGGITPDAAARTGPTRRVVSAPRTKSE